MPEMRYIAHHGFNPEDEDDSNGRCGMGILVFPLFVLGLVALSVFLLAKKAIKESERVRLAELARQKTEEAFKARLDQLLPGRRPLIVYNKVQKYVAFAVFDQMRTPHTVGNKILLTEAGEKILVKTTACLHQQWSWSDDEFVDDMIQSLTGMKKALIHDVRNDGYNLWYEANRRIFQHCEDLYVQVGSKTPSGITREEIERSCVTCFTLADVWDVLQKDLEASISVRTKIR